MKASGVLEKLGSWLTASTFEDSIERTGTFSSCEGDAVCLTSRSEPGAEGQTYRSNFFVHQQFSRKARVALLAEQASPSAHDAKPREKSGSKGENSEAELSESDDKLHKAFNIDPVLTMVPRGGSRSFIQKLFSDGEATPSFARAERPRANQKSSLRAESAVWYDTEPEKCPESFAGFTHPSAYLPEEYYAQFPPLDAAYRSPPRVPPTRKRAGPKRTLPTTPIPRYAPQGVGSENRVELGRIEEVGKKALYVKNIPNKYTKKMLLKLFDQDFKGGYDFFYLPIDFNNNCNIGFAFIKFTELVNVRRFCEKYANRKWPHFNSEKICEVRYARMQRAEEMIEHFKNSSLWRKADPRCLPFMSPSVALHLN